MQDSEQSHKQIASPFYRFLFDTINEKRGNANGEK